MNPETALADDLKAHLAICQEMLAAVQEEARGLTSEADSSPAFTAHQARKELFPRLEASLEKLRAHRLQREALPEDQRKLPPEIQRLLRETQDLTLRVLMNDRENEQRLLRRGLLPARQIPSINRQRPHFVADLYRRNTG